MNPTPLTRRGFLGQTALLGATFAATTRLKSAESPSNKIRVGVMGLGRGRRHIAGYTQLPGVEVAYVCDVDSRRLEAGLEQARKAQSAPVKAVKDFRTILDDPTIDAISIATPHYWHTPAAVLACSAGKHVYVEKPGSHSPQESEWIVAAARKHKRVMQMGAQRRSNAFIIEAFEQMHGGIVGEIYFAKAFLGGKRKSLGFGKLAPVPEWLDYQLWQGPAPERPYRDNVIHYNWHWHWVWGGGEMDNNGSHMMDLARWGMRVDYPKRITCTGGRYSFRDDQETPDTITTAYDFGKVGIALEVSDCNPRKPQSIPICAFYGANGSVLIREESYSIYDYDGNELAGRVQKFDDVTHFRNFVETIRGREKLNLEIAEGQKSSLMCHLANIAYRTGQTVDFDPATRRMVNPSAAAQALWGLEYRPGWEPKV